MDPADAETAVERAALGLSGASRDRDDWSEEGRGGEAAEIRRALGVESAFGYHVEGRTRRSGTALPSVAAVVEARVPHFPCLRGHTYEGCLGEACPLETCWTGGATVSFARRQREESRVAAALYLPGAPCHTCAHLVEDEVVVPAPHAIGQPGATPAAVRRTRMAQEGHDPGTVTLQRVNCGQGLWAHPISLASFLTKRIPMLDQEEPERCPCYARRPDPHPAVVAHLRRRRERARERREGRSAAREEKED